MKRKNIKMEKIRTLNVNNKNNVVFCCGDRSIDD